MGLFRRGFKEVEKEEKRREERKKQGNQLYRFYLAKDKDQALLTFLTEEPVNFYEHHVKTYRNGKDVYDNIPCAGDSCKYCANGERPTFKSAWLVVDHRPYEYEDKDGNKQRKEFTLRLYVVGTKVAGLLQRKSSRYGLTNYQYTIERIGRDTSTTYSLEQEDTIKLTPDLVQKYLPDHLKELYDGTMDSLYDIIEKEIIKGLPVDNNSDDEELTGASTYNKNLVSVDDDEEEEEAPKPKSKLKLGKKKPIETKIKKKPKLVLKKK